MSEPEQLTSVEGMTSEEIAQAYEEGRLDAYLARPSRPGSPEAEAEAQAIRLLSPEQIADAYRSGALDSYLASRTR